MALLFHTFSIPKHKYIFDANTNCVFSVNEEQYKAMSEIKEGIETPENLSVLRSFQEKGFCLDVVIERIENPDGEFIEAHLTQKIQQCTLQVTQKCNLRCDYCTYSGLYKTREHSPKTMSFETAKRAIDFTLGNSEDSPTLAFAFYGGEPLLELPLINECVEYIKKHAPKRKIIFTVTTNGTLLTTDVYQSLVRSKININISLDGPKQIHDMSRKFPNNEGSYDLIMKNIQEIHNKYPDAHENLSFLAVVNPAMDDDYCIQTLFKSDDIIPLYNYTSNFLSELYSEKEINYSDAFLLAYNHEYCKFLLFMLNRLKKENISTIFDNRIGRLELEYRQLSKIPKLPAVFHPSGPCIAGAQRLFIDVHGNFFPCERVSESSVVMNIGNLNDGFNIKKARVLMNPGQTTEDECKKCWVIMHCSMCAAFSDDLTELSREQRLSQCKSAKMQYEQTLKTICFLKESGYAFER